MEHTSHQIKNVRNAIKISKKPPKWPFNVAIFGLSFVKLYLIEEWQMTEICASKPKAHQ